MGIACIVLFQYTYIIAQNFALIPLSLLVVALASVVTEVTLGVQLLLAVLALVAIVVVAVVAAGVEALVL